MTAPQLADFDVILVNSSAGKDSQAMLDTLVAQADRESVRDRIVVVHCNLGRVEWEGTAELAREQAEHYGVRYVEVSRPQGDLLDHVRQRGMWPSASARYCTSDHKRAQVLKVITQLVNEWRQAHGKRQVRVLNCLGIRAAESPARAKKVPYQRNERASNGKRDVWEYLPIFDWTESHVWDRIARSGVRYHYAYDLGMPRLSCAFCIFAPKSALMLSARHNPELFQQYLETEREIGHTFRQDCSLQDVADALGEGETVQAVPAWEM